jgi:hypothetical protein
MDLFSTIILFSGNDSFEKNKLSRGILFPATVT